MTRHQGISFLKSGIRVMGYIALVGSVTGGDFKTHIVLASFCLILAEGLGILEEVGQNYGS